MNVICLEDAAFYELIKEVISKLKLQENTAQDSWISTQEAMRLLNVKSKSTMQMLRDMGKIRYSQPQKKIILYDRASIMAYLGNNAKNTF